MRWADAAPGGGESEDWRWWRLIQLKNSSPYLPDLTRPTPETSSRCIVYSVFQTDAAGSAFTIGYQFGTEQYENWQEDTVQTSIYDCGYLPNSRQQIFTLSTCTDSGMEQDRLVVHCAVLTE